jgi:hypothetical protein
VVVADRLLEIHDVGRHQGVGLVVGECAIQLEVERDDGERQRRQHFVAEHGRDGVSRHAVARVHDRGQRADLTEVHKRPQVPRVVGEKIPLLHGAGAVRLFGGAVEERLGSVADLGEAGRLADRPSPWTAHLNPVVLGRIVAGREHRAGTVERARRVVEHVG